jgi:hypothetical protein
LVEFLSWIFQLFRSTTIGSMREALRAGRYPANSATIANVTTTAANVTGSVGFVPKSSAEIALATNNEAMVPAATPIKAGTRAWNSLFVRQAPLLGGIRHNPLLAALHSQC